MRKYFIPYSDENPATVLVNGHRMVILSNDRSSLQDELELLGANKLKQIRAGDSEAEDRIVLHRIAAKAHAGVVVAPSDLALSDVLRNLKAELPWLQ
jgi:hypothetical protein